MANDKDYFVDKPRLTTFQQLELVRDKVRSTGPKYFIYYSERVHSESAVFAGQFIEHRAIGRVVQVIGTGPHRVNPLLRPSWFFDRRKFGGILCDIGSHQIEQYLHFTGSDDARVVASKVANYANKEHPCFEDFGDCSLMSGNGATGYFRVDLFTPEGLSSWGDGGTFLLGTEGFLELRKYLDVARDSEGDHVFLVDKKGETHVPVKGKVGFPFFGQLILDCINRTDNAMPSTARVESSRTEPRGRARCASG